jgi:hypothetical protein
MVEPIETAMRIAQERGKPVKEDWWNLLNFAYFQQENYSKVRDIQKVLLQNWLAKSPLLEISRRRIHGAW